MHPDVPTITLVVAVPLAIVLIYLTVKGIMSSFDKRTYDVAQPYSDPSIELGCLITWFLLLIIWSFPISFGIGVIMGIVSIFKFDYPVYCILLSLGFLEICLLTGWFAIKMTFILADYE